MVGKGAKGIGILWKDRGKGKGQLIELHSWRPPTEVPKSRANKSTEKVLRKVPAPNGVPRKVPKKRFGLRASVQAVMRLEG